MEMTLDAILEAYNAHGCVWETQERVRDYIRDHSLYSFQDRIESVMANYALMLDYLERGFKDDKRDRFYQEAVAETYRLIQDLRIADRKKTNPSYKVAAAHAATVNMDQAEIRNRLEGFVADQAMLALEPDSVRQERHRALYERHTDYVSRLFDSIFVSSQWSEAEMGFYLDLLSSPTVDILDVQVLVSAVTLSCVNVFDPRKQQLLCDLFLASADEHVRQRALVGWAFSLRWDEKMMLDRQRRSALKLMAHDTGCRQLMELQKQMVYCVNAEADNRKIQRDIMPTLLNNSHLQITKFGIAEKEEDSLRDILHPDADEKAMDEVEATIAKMREMEKSGSDIYFGGFRHMKRYAFFYTLSNWFVPFFTDHPYLRNFIGKHPGNDVILGNVLSGGPFCNSDKYSFAFAFSQVIDRIPDNLKEMLRVGSVGMVMVPESEQQSPAYIRRMYLQDLYRFFQLYSSKGDFTDPFLSTRHAGEPNVFVGIGDIFGGTQMGLWYLDFLRFVSKFGAADSLGCRGAVTDICAFHQDPDNRDYQLFVAYDHLKYGDPEQALPVFRRLTDRDPHDEWALKGLVRYYLLRHRYDDAEKVCRQLVDLCPGHIVYQLNLCVCLISLGRSNEAMPTLYKLDYEHPDHPDVQRVLAWGQMNGGKYVQALGVYQKLCAGPSVAPDDWLNQGYSLWLTGDVAAAVASFRRYVEQMGRKLPADVDVLMEAFGKDADFLSKQGVSETDRRLIVDLASRSS